MTAPRLALVLLFASTAVAAQDAGQAEARALLQRLAQAHADLTHFTATYVQRRTTKLVKKPLESSGTLAFRREPGCVVFRVEKPRVAVIRLDAQHYEVYRPEQQRLERFVLPSDEMPKLLFDALALTEERLRERFDVAGSEKVDGERDLRRVKLVPKDEKTRRVAAHIALVLDAKTARLVGFGYTDPRGDQVEVDLSEVVQPKDAPAETFELEVPADTKVMVQKIPEPEGEAKPVPRRAGGAMPVVR